MLVTPMHRGVRWGMAVRTKDRMHAKNVMSDQSCVHINAVASVKHPKRRECQECVKIGGTWVHLRTCQECGGTHRCGCRVLVPHSLLSGAGNGSAANVVAPSTKP